MGKNVTVVGPVNMYGCQVGDNVLVGPFSEIQANVSIGAGTRIQSHSFICSKVTIGEDCFIGHGVVFTNDLLRGGPARGVALKYRETLIGDRVSIGSNATLLPVSICDDVIIGAGSVVTKNIDTPGTYAGNPVKRLGGASD